MLPRCEVRPVLQFRSRAAVSRVH